MYQDSRKGRVGSMINFGGYFLYRFSFRVGRESGIGMFVMTTSVFCKVIFPFRSQSIDIGHDYQPILQGSSSLVFFPLSVSHPKGIWRGIAAGSGS